MKLDLKRRNIQSKYREKINVKKAERQHSAEALFVFAFFILLGFLVFQNYIDW
ncbi:hypothetical protein ACLZHR_10290 [Priestia aryabhattai]|uniref:hypothetical protein n=1 Tax=Priestia TaxID=2800373 RepID=UPI0015F40A17|nr:MULTISPECIES: hypothetical protein [Priestia]MCL9635740.1 hypothetical protein [Bacillus zanthoxyli]MCQ9283208.1 hypothetical protein [Priestia aryabhattai]MED3960249.1 hypothetical protein [Priestia aryabhattai]